MTFPCRPLVALLIALASLTTRASERPRVVAYVPNWIELASYAKTIAFEQVTHLNIAFENPVNDQGDLSFNPENETLITLAHARQVKVLVSIGGGSASNDKKLRKFYDHLLHTGQRAAFVRKLAAYITLHQFDGLDVDIEGPAINADYAGFILELAAVLKPQGRLLTAALSKGYGGDKVPTAVFQHFDFINIMAYDATGPWDPDRPGQHSSLAFAQENITWWLGRGLPKDKAVLGLPFYGYGFGKAFKKSDYAYAQIIQRHPGAENTDQTGETIWYNGLPTIRSKCRLARDQGLGGVMIWPLNADAPGEKSLLKAIHDTLTPPPAHKVSKPGMPQQR